MNLQNLRYSLCFIHIQSTINSAIETHPIWLYSNNIHPPFKHQSRTKSTLYSTTKDTPSTYTIRNATPNDARALASLSADCFDSAVFVPFPKYIQNVVRQAIILEYALGYYLRLTIQQDHSSILIAQDIQSGSVIGSIELSLFPLRDFIYDSSISQLSQLFKPKFDFIPKDSIIHGFWLWESDKCAYVSNLAVDKRWRRRGIASALICECESIVCTQWNLYAVYLHYEEGNESAEKLYRNNGFLVLGRDSFKIAKVLNFTTRILAGKVLKSNRVQ
mmetsp:Transcript_2492/g.4378  ORF Transcript_2492/g.4378 Transcript_2492/m.4378 type:complete len:275 (-) Transcript_2492:2692-3516(-)